MKKLAKVLMVAAPVLALAACSSSDKQLINKVNFTVI